MALSASRVGAAGDAPFLGGALGDLHSKSPPGGNLRRAFA